MASSASMNARWQRPIETIPSKLEASKSGEAGRPIDRRSASSRQREEPKPHPTILIAAADPDLRERLLQALREDNCLVLEAKCADDTLQMARFHSRPIHVLLVEEALIDEALAGYLERLRPHMKILTLESQANIGAPSTLAALAKARQLLKGAR